MLSETSQVDKAILSYDGVVSQFGFLQGKVLTVIDASYSDVVQRKAVKDLIKDAFRSQMEWIYQISHQPEGSGSDASHPSIPNPLGE